jgi:alkylation response protein AidB-like acyl-CoA dehydrogenase
MNINFSDEDVNFKKEVREFINSNLPKELQTKISNGGSASKEETIAWQKALNKKKWFAPGWPKEYGGSEMSVMRKYILDLELSLADTPTLIPFGVTMIAPVLIEFGTKKQKDYFLPKILESDHWWCQGYSEPNSGSDLASLSTKAVLENDMYIINGTKTWTTLAQFADWMFCLVRTSTKGKPQEGISFIMIDMKSKGISVDPIITLDGSHEINTVYLENVKVPKENLIYEVNKGWSVAKFLLSHERTSIAAVGRSKSALRKLKEIAAIEYDNDEKPLINDRRFRDQLTTLEMDLKALEYTELRILSKESQGTAPGPEASLLKIQGSEIQQRITELTLNAVGYQGLIHNGENINYDRLNDFSVVPDYAENAASNYLNKRKTTIYGGSNEIQKNILSKMVLGL